MSVQGADNFADAPLLPPGSTSLPTPNAALTVESGEPVGSMTRTAWWKFQPTSPVVLDFSASENVDLCYLSIFTGTGYGDLHYVDEGGPVLSLFPEPGTTYYLQMGVFTGVASDYILATSVLTPGPWRDDMPDQQTSQTSTSPEAWRHGYIEWGGTLDPDLLTTAVSFGGAGTPYVPPAFVDPTQTPAPPFLDEAVSQWETVYGQSQEHGTAGREDYWYNASYSWAVQWQTFNLPATPSGASLGFEKWDLPPDVVDPWTGEFVDGALGVEWGTPYLIGDATLSASFSHQGGSTLSSWYVVTRPVAPTETSEFLSHAEIQGLTRQAAGMTPATPDGTVVTGTAPFEAWDESRVLVALVDDHVYDSTPYSAATASASAAALFFINQGYRIPYRLLYADAPASSPAPPLRLFPRDDGLGFSSSARIFPQPSSEQGSNRIGGYW